MDGRPFTWQEERFLGHRPSSWGVESISRFDALLSALSQPSDLQVDRSCLSVLISRPFLDDGLRRHRCSVMRCFGNGRIRIERGI